MAEKEIKAATFARGSQVPTAFAPNMFQPLLQEFSGRGRRPQSEDCAPPKSKHAMEGTPRSSMTSQGRQKRPRLPKGSRQR